MKRVSWQMMLGLSLLALSIVFYLGHYLLFRDAHHIFIYLIGDLAFLPIDVLLVTLIIDKLLTAKEKKAKLNKLNMVIGAFFSEVGTSLLKAFSQFDAHIEGIRKDLLVSPQWSDGEFSDLGNQVKMHSYQIEAKKGDLVFLQNFMKEKKDFLLALLENPNLLEHETFTELLWAVFHLAEELALREDVKKLTEGDYAHLAGDIKRAYGSLALEWLAYMKHLKRDYPYLFSLAMRTNPFDPKASVQIQ